MTITQWTRLIYIFLFLTMYRYQNRRYVKMTSKTKLRTKLNSFFFNSTKWKRQNQLRLEQLRHQANLEKEMISNEHSGNLLTKQVYKRMEISIFFVLQRL